MRKLLTSVALLLLACASAHAGTFVEISRTDLVDLLRAPETQKLWFEEGRLRIENERADVLEIFKDETLYLIEPAQRRYTVLDREDSGVAAGAALATGITPSPGTSPRAAAAALLTSLGHTGEAIETPSVNAPQATGRTETVAGQACRVWELRREGQKEQEWCIVAASALPSGAELQSTMRAVGTRLAGALEHMSGANRDSVASSWSQLQGIDGVPLLERVFQGGRAVVEFRLTGLRVEPIPVTAFDIPTTYKRHTFGAHAALTATNAERAGAAIHSRHSGS